MCDVCIAYKCLSKKGYSARNYDFIAKGSAEFAFARLKIKR